MAGRAWSKQEEEILRDLAKAGHGARKIMTVLKSRTVHAVQQKADAMDVRLGSPEPEIDFDAFKNLMKAERSVKCL